jgi:hypothetical protein
LKTKKNFPENSDELGNSENNQNESTGNEMDYSQGNYDSPCGDVLYPGFSEPCYPTGTFDEFH